MKKISFNEFRNSSVNYLNSKHFKKGYTTIINNSLINNGFVVNIDNPSCGRHPTISADFVRRHNIFTLQIEINCAITNNYKNIKN